jgi:hypothetical protein
MYFSQTCATGAWPHLHGLLTIKFRSCFRDYVSFFITILSPQIDHGGIYIQNMKALALKIKKKSAIFLSCNLQCTLYMKIWTLNTLTPQALVPSFLLDWIFILKRILNANCSRELQIFFLSLEPVPSYFVCKCSKI